MKDSGIPWIGMIPSDWIILPIKRVKDKTHPYPIGDGDHGSIKPEDYIDEGIPYIRVQNMSWGGPIIMENIAYISEKVNELNKKSELHPNDILVAKTGATIGKTCIIPANMPKANTTSSVGKVTVGKDFSSKYIFYLLGSEVCIRQMWLKAGQKSAQPGFNIDELVDFKIPIPQDLPTQQRIADFLDRKCAEIDELAALQETMIAELKRYKQSVITEAVTKGLDLNVPMQDSGVEWIGKIPQKWEVRAIKTMATLKSGSNITTNDIKEEKIGFPVYGGNGLRGYYSEYSDEGNYALIGRQGALCGNINYAHGKFWATDHCVVCYPKVEFELIWFGETLRTMNLNQYSLSSAQPGLSVERIKEKLMPVPPLTEQRAIADYLDKKCAEIDELIAIKQQKVEALKEYKKSVIFEYVTGKKEVL